MGYVYQLSQFQFINYRNLERVSERSFTSEQRKKVIYGRIKLGKGRNNRRIIGK